MSREGGLDAAATTAEMLTALPTGTLQDAIKVLQGSAQAEIYMAGYVMSKRLDWPDWEARSAELRQRADQRTAVALVLQAEVDGREGS